MLNLDYNVYKTYTWHGIQIGNSILEKLHLCYTNGKIEGIEMVETKSAMVIPMFGV